MSDEPTDTPPPTDDTPHDELMAIAGVLLAVVDELAAMRREMATTRRSIELLGSEIAGLGELVVFDVTPDGVRVPVIRAMLA